MKLKSLFALVTLFAGPAMAHIEIGHYQGTGNGRPCDIEVTAVQFDNNIQHPLAERVLITANNQYGATLSHLPKVDLATGTIEQEKGVLTGVVLEDMGDGDLLKMAIVLQMSPTGPAKYTMIQNYGDQKIIAVCDGLKKSGTN